MTERERRESAAATAVTAAIAEHVKALRQARGWSLEELASRSGVSKGMLVQLETARTNPSIGTLCRVAEAFGVDMGRLIEAGPQPAVRVLNAATSPVLWRGTSGGTARLSTAVSEPAFVELWEWRLEPGERHTSSEHAPGTREIFHVRAGTLIVTVDAVDHAVPAGSLIDFPGDRPHGYRNDTTTLTEATLTVVMPPGEWDRRRPGL